MPRRLKVSLFLFLMLLLLSSTQFLARHANSAETEESTGPAAFQIPEAEKPFWDAAQMFVDAYAQRDAASIGALFTEDAEIFDEFGDVTQGRDDIIALYEQVFREYPRAAIDEINIHRVRYITDRVAIEEGRVVSASGSGGGRTMSRYVAIHVNEDGAWRIDMLKNFAQEGLSRNEQLQRLAWLEGEWVSEDDESVVHTDCTWSDDGNYLLRRFTVRISGQDVMNGVQRIGWDPLQKQIRAWTFDSQGGFAEGVWNQNRDQWIVVSSGVNSEGESASATAIYTIIDAEMFTWQYRNLLVGNEFRKDIKPIVMTRRPPSPAAVAK